MSVDLLKRTAQKAKDIVCCKRLTEHERTEQQKMERFEYVKERQTQKTTAADERIQTITETCDKLKQKLQQDNKRNLEELQKSIGKLAILQTMRENEKHAPANKQISAAGKAYEERLKEIEMEEERVKKVIERLEKRKEQLEKKKESAKEKIKNAAEECEQQNEKLEEEERESQTVDIDITDDGLTKEDTTADKSPPDSGDQQPSTSSSAKEDAENKDEKQSSNATAKQGDGHEKADVSESECVSKYKFFDGKNTVFIPITQVVSA